MGKVYRGVRDSDSLDVAIKILQNPDSGIGDNQIAIRFQREIQLAQSLQHPHIVRTYESGVLDDGTTYVVMELLSGASLSEYVQEHGPLNHHEAQVCLQTISSALHYAHERGIIHRDIKPDNIFRTDEGRFVLFDFGLAHDSDVTQITATGQVLGTFYYMSPEQLHGAPPGPPTDIYSLGLSVLYGLTGSRPYSQDQIIQIASGRYDAVDTLLSGDLFRHENPVSQVLSVCLAPLVEQRYQTAQEVIDHLSGKKIERPSAKKKAEHHQKPALVSRPIQATTPVKPDVQINRTEQRSTVRRTTLAGVVVLLGGLIFLVSSISDPIQQNGALSAGFPAESDGNQRQNQEARIEDLVEEILSSPKIPEDDTSGRLKQLGTLVGKSRYFQVLNVRDDCPPEVVSLMYLIRILESGTHKAKKVTLLDLYSALFKRIDSLEFLLSHSSDFLYQLINKARSDDDIQVFKSLKRFWKESSDPVLKAGGAVSFVYYTKKQTDAEDREATLVELASIRSIVLAYKSICTKDAILENPLGIVAFARSVSLVHKYPHYDYYYEKCRVLADDEDLSALLVWPEVVFQLGFFCRRFSEGRPGKVISVEQRNTWLRTSIVYFTKAFALMDSPLRSSRKIDCLRAYFSSTQTLGQFQEQYDLIHRLSNDGMIERDMAILELYKAKAAINLTRWTEAREILERAMPLAQKWDRGPWRYRHYLNTITLAGY